MNKTTKVLAVDPGGTTGWATFELPVNEDGAPQWHHNFSDHWTNAGQIDKLDHHSALWNLLELEDPDYVVCERFERRNNDFATLVSVEYIGTVKTWCQTRHKKLTMQGASQAKKFATDIKLSNLGILIRPSTKYPHAIDARRHLLCFLTLTQNLPEVRNRVLHILRHHS